MTRPARIRRPANVAPEMRPVLDAIDQAMADNTKHLAQGILTEEYQWTGEAVKRIPHGLGRKLRGWLPVRIRAATYIAFFEDTTADMGSMGDTHVAIKANDACVAQFLVW